MTDMPDIAGPAMPQVAGPVALESLIARRRAPYTFETAKWGYIVRKTAAPDVGVILLQVIALILGAGFIAAGIGMMLLPHMMTLSVDLLMRACATLFFFGLAGYLLWYASRGIESELQIDLHHSVIREVVRNRMGRATLIGRHPFYAIGGVFLDRVHPRPGFATLVLRHRNTAQILTVVSGPEKALEPLLHRLGRDLIIGSAPGPLVAQAEAAFRSSRPVARI